MALNNGKHIVEEIDGVRCTIVEKNLTESRLNFLKNIMHINGYETKVLELPKAEGSAEKTYTLGVTNLLFNPVIDVYERRLKSETGHIITPAYWLQKSSAETEAEVNYWNFIPRQN